MTLAAQHEQGNTEQQFLSTLRDQYEAKGFSFEIDPAPQHVPKFLGNYKPDAIAHKPGANIAIEVRQRQNRATDLTLQVIRNRFVGQPDWQFVVAYTGEDPLKTLTIPTSSISELRARLEKVRALEARGEYQAAFVFGWSLLEAVLNRIEGASGTRPRTPGSVVQTLAMRGYIDPQLEQRVRPLISLRNRVVHGDLRAQPSPEEVLVILSAVEAALSDA